MNTLSNTLDDLYRKTRQEVSIEKTAESMVFSALRDDGVEKVASYEDAESLTDEELEELEAQLRQDVAYEGIDKVAGALDLDGQEKIAQDVLGGKIMAHAMVQEFGLIKEAMSQGLCRVCKSAPFTGGTSLCYNCAA